MTGLSHSSPVIYPRMIFLKQMFNQGALLLPLLQSFCIVLRKKKSKLFSSAHEALHSLPPSTIPVPAHVFHHLAFRHAAPYHSNVLPVFKTQLKIPLLSSATPAPISVSLNLSVLHPYFTYLTHSFTQQTSECLYVTGIISSLCDDDLYVSLPHLNANSVDSGFNLNIVSSG